MKLYIVRHGEAGSAQTDSARELTERGRNQAQSAANWLANKVKEPVVLWSSPYQRTLQTAKFISDTLSTDIISHDCLMPDVTPKKVVGELINEHKNIILVTHLPLVGRLASLLVDGSIYDQPWSAAEIWQLEGDIYASGCLQNTNIWYPSLDAM